MFQPLSTTAPVTPPAQPQPLAQHAGQTPAAVDFEVAIVGGGIVGLTLACALKDAGMRIALIEAKPREAGLTRSRAYAVTLMSGQIFQGLGIWQQVLPQITTFRQIRLAESDYPAVVNLQPADLGTAALGYVAEHRVLLQALLDRLEGSQQVSWLCPAQVIGVDYQLDHAAVTILSDGREETIRTRLLVAADGSRSQIRQAAGIGTHGWQYWQSCVTAVIRSEQPHGNIAREHFWESGPFATLPLPGNRSQIVLTAPHAEAQAWLEADAADFLAELDRRYAGQLGKLELVGDRFLFPVQLMHCNGYTRSRLALVGDAAHSCHPVGGQGLNLGIRDAAALAQVIQTAYRQGKDIGSLAILKRYERWRRLENLTILGFTDVLDRLFSTRWLPFVVLRRLSLRVMRSLRICRFLALRLMTGLSGRVPELARR